MSITDDGGAAFPRTGATDLQGYSPDARGMSLRDYFAAHAPAMPDQWFADSVSHWGEAHAAWAYFYADAMLKARLA